MWIKAWKVIQWCMQWKWGFAIQMSQTKIFYAKKVTHLCFQALSDSSYASFCALSSSILHNFYKILETDSNLTQKYKKYIWKTRQCGSRHEKSYNGVCSGNEVLQYKWVKLKYFMPKRWLICASRPYLTDHMLHFVHSPHRYYITFTGSWKLIQIRRRDKRNLKSYTMWIDPEA